MSIQQTLVGLERTFGGRASVLSHTISADNQLEADESSWLRLGSPFPMTSMRVYNRAREEIQIPTDFVEDLIQASLGRELPGGVTFNRDVSIGAMHTDDLPISGHEYSNIFIVVSFGLNADIPLPRDAHISAEMYFGWRATSGTLRVADDWHLNVSVSNVGPLRRRHVRRNVVQSLTSSGTEPSAGDQIRDGLRGVFDRTGIQNWYVIPGNGEHNNRENDVLVRHEASFFVVER